MYNKRLIKKSSGSLEPFSSKKLYSSIARTGLNSKLSKNIVDQIVSKVQTDSSTKEIYKHAIKLIKRKSTVAASRYSLKKSLLNLGPTGYEFEKYIAKYFEAIGFKTSVGIICQGKFVTHEVDVIASTEDKLYFTECKFHNNSGRKNDIKVALYVKARWDDLRQGKNGKNLDGYYLVSNTAFTKDAITYSCGVGLKLLGVNAPEKESLLDEIKALKLYPITSLIKLKKIYLNVLLSKGIILCSELLHQKKLLLKIGMSENEIIQLYSEINSLLHN